MQSKKKLSAKYYLVEAILDARLPEHSIHGFLTYKQIAMLIGSATTFCRNIGRIIFAYAARHPEWNTSLVRKSA